MRIARLVGPAAGRRNPIRYPPHRARRNSFARGLFRCTQRRAATAQGQSRQGNPGLDRWLI